MTTKSMQLVDGPTLLRELFPAEECRPSLRWLRMRQADRTIPHVRIGGKVLFERGAVLAALDRCRVTVD